MSLFSSCLVSIHSFGDLINCSTAEFASLRSVSNLYSLAQTFLKKVTSHFLLSHRQQATFSKHRRDLHPLVSHRGIPPSLFHSSVHISSCITSYSLNNTILSTQSRYLQRSLHNFIERQEHILFHHPPISPRQQHSISSHQHC